MKFFHFTLLSSLFALVLSACTTSINPSLPTAVVPPLADVDAARAKWDNANFENYMVQVEAMDNSGSFRVRVVVKDGEIDTAILEDVLPNGNYANPRTLSAADAEEYTVEAIFDRLEQDVLQLGPAPVNLDVVFDPSYGFPSIIEAEAISTLNDEGKLSLNRDHNYSMSLTVTELLEDIFGLTKEPTVMLKRTGGETLRCDLLRLYADRSSIYSDECNQLLLQITPPLLLFTELEELRGEFASLNTTQELPGGGTQVLTITGTGTGEATPAEVEEAWRITEELVVLLSKPIGDGLTLIYSLGNQVAGMEMISFTAQPANLTLAGNLQGLQVHPNGELIVYADDQGVQTLVLETGATPVQLLNPPESGYYFVRRINSEVVIISQIFEDGSTTLGWSFIERRRFREAIPPEGANGFGCDTGVDLSPTANLLVVGGSNTDAACNLLPGLTIVDLEGETTESILDNQTVFSPVWSRDGSQIAFAQVDGPAVNLYLINPDGNGLKALTSYSSGGINSLAWGTKGNIYIGVNGLENPDEDGIYILNIHSGETRQLIIGSNVLVRQVAPDGDHLAFYENDGDFKIMIVPFNQIVPVVQGVGSFVTVGGWISLDE